MKEGNALPANTGQTGLLDMPSARLIPDWNVRASYSWAHPYATYSVTAGVMPWLEVNGRLTETRGVPALSSSYGNAKDKAIDLKLKLHGETESWPALALGATDIHGTALFTSRYLVASKLIGPFDVTLGLGQGILAGEVTKGGGSSGSASQDAAVEFLTSGATRTRPFGGVEFRVTEDLSLLAEYSSLNYGNMYKLTEVSDPGTSPLNFGLRYRLWDNYLLSFSYLRGKYFGWSLSANFPFDPHGILSWKEQPFWVPGEELKLRAQQASNEELAAIISDEIVAEKFSNVRVSVSDSSVWLEIENPTYQSNAKAIGRAGRAVADFVPDRIEWLYISLKSRDLVIMTVKLGRQALEAFLDNRLDGETLLEFSTLSNGGNDFRQVFFTEEPSAAPLTAPAGSKRLRFGYKPSWQTLINDPSGFLKNRFSILWKATYFPWQGGVFSGRIRTPLYNDISSSNKVVEKEPVSTDFILYRSQTEPRLETLAFDQIFELPGQWLGRGEIGLFETAYGGVGGEVFRFFADGRWGLGLEGEWVWKRDLDNEFEVQEDHSFKTCFVNIYHQLLPDYGVDVGLKLGRFLAGDWGGRLDISRTYKYFTLGAWYSITDTSVFTASYNQGYNDKGVYLTIPFSIFADYDHPARLTYSISPWTRDPGQTVSQVTHLYPLAQRGNIDSFQREIEHMKD